MPKVFIDTNILVYTMDNKDLGKQLLARQTINTIVNNHFPVISTQVIQEFYVATTLKLKANPMIIKSIVHNFRNMEVVDNDIGLTEQAIDISVMSKISFWDSLIIAAAEKASCEFVLSEYLNTGQVFRGIKVINPFGDIPWL